MPEIETPAPLTFEQWAKARGTAPEWSAAACVYYRWPVGFELTGEAYDAAIVTVQTIETR